jgi:hypothetical protein
MTFRQEKEASSDRKGPRKGPRTPASAARQPLRVGYDGAAGARVDATWRAAGGGRYGGVLYELRANLGFDVLKTVVTDFTWAGRRPDDTLVLLPSLGASGTF